MNAHIYITEISPPRSRGTLASIPQLTTRFGIFAGFFTCYGSVNISSSLSWRPPFALQAIVAYVFSFYTLVLLSESPRWLSSRGLQDQAQVAWEKLEVVVEEREKIAEGSDALGVLQQLKARDILAVLGKDVWRQTALGVFLMGMQQLSGIDGVLYVRIFIFLVCSALHWSVLYAILTVMLGRSLYHLS